MAQGVPKDGRIQEEGTPRETFIDVRVFESVGRGKDRREGRGKSRSGEGGGREGGKETGREMEAGIEQAQQNRSAAQTRPRE